MYNYQKSFEWGEVDHGHNSIAVVVTAVAIPRLVSLSALLPYRRISRMSLFLDQPLVGHTYRVPFLESGTMPTRAQALFLTYLCVINTVLMCLPLRTLQPNARQPGLDRQRLMIIGDRAGVLAAANLIPLLLTSARNNVLLWITNWSQTTFLLTHRWLGYIVILHTVVHSAGLLHAFLKYSDHTAESKLPYWFWGIISTLAICLIWPLAILPVRRKFYKAFLVAHQLLAALALIAYFLHIWYLYEYNWGYEIFVYVAGATWGLDRLIRVLKIVRSGSRTAVVTSFGSDSDVLKLEIPGRPCEGHVYLYFPTLTWRFWENHPFSVLSSLRTVQQDSIVSDSGSATPEEKGPRSITRASNTHSTRIEPLTTLLLRPQSGTTLKLLQKTRAQNSSLSIPVWIESSYHSQPTGTLRHCSTLVCIAGGGGITAILPILRDFSGPEARLYWGVKYRDIVDAIAPEMSVLEGRVKTELSVGQRLDINAILSSELLNNDGVDGDVGVVVCGPPAMADRVRLVVGSLASKSKRGIVFVDEAFSW